MIFEYPTNTDKFNKSRLPGLYSNQDKILSVVTIVTDTFDPNK